MFHNYLSRRQWMSTPKSNVLNNWESFLTVIIFYKCTCIIIFDMFSLPRFLFIRHITILDFSGSSKTKGEWLLDSCDRYRSIMDSVCCWIGWNYGPSRRHPVGSDREETRAAISHNSTNNPLELNLAGNFCKVYLSCKGLGRCGSSEPLRGGTCVRGRSSASGHPWNTR